MITFFLPARVECYSLNFKMPFNFHLIHIIFSLVLVTCQTDDLGEVVFVNLVFRHGDRTPIDPYPNDPYKNNSYWPVDWGELTNVGKYGHYKLGQWLRNRYSQLLPKEYYKKDIHIQSTDVDRTLMSAYSNLAGLYEPNLQTNWNHNIKWTPIPVHTVPKNLDWVLAAEAPCLKYNSELDKLLSSPKFKKINEDNAALYNYLTQYTGTNISSVIDVERIYDSLYIEDLYKFPLPSWTKKVYPDPMKEISEFTFSIPCYTPLLAKLKIGPLLGDILKHMEDKASGKLTEKVWMYSAHDVTVANVLKALDLFEPHCPPYYSLVLFELRKINENYFVAIHYRNSSLFPPYFMQLKGCDRLCPLDKFKSIVSPLIPKDWKKECQVIRLVENIFDTAASITFITIVSLALILLFSLGIVVKFYRSRRWSQADFAYKSLNSEIPS